MANFNTLPTQQIKKGHKKYLQINLTGALDKLPLQILYYKEHGYRDFIVVGSSSGTFSYSHMFGKIMKSIYKLIELHDITIIFTGFPKCIFDNYVLSPDKKWYYLDNLDFLETEGEELEKLDSCRFCAYNSQCLGIDPQYLKKQRSREFIPFLSNSDKVRLYSDKIQNLGSDELIGIGEILLDDLQKDQDFSMRHFYLLKSYPGMRERGKIDGIGYFIYNTRDSFEENFQLFKDLFYIDLLDDLKEYLSGSPEFLLKFEPLEDGNLRKSLEFRFENLDYESKCDIEEILGRQIDGRTIVLFDDEDPRIFKKIDSVPTIKVKEFMKEIPLERKRNILRFLNSMLKPIKDFIYSKDEGYLSFLFSIDKNSSKVHQLAQIFSLDLRYLREMKLSHLHFEIYADRDEKVTFLYCSDELKELTREEEEEEFELETV